jgi:hypothetical protein
VSDRPLLAVSTAKRTLDQRIRVLLGLPCTLALIYVLPSSLLVLAVLLVFWCLLFRPWQLEELISFAIAAVFFLLQNYACLKTGLFEFRTKDVLLMPYYEPFLWGFYFLSLKRFISGTKSVRFAITKNAVIGVLATSIVFSVFSLFPSLFFPATVFSTLFLFALFHTRLDLYYAVCSLVLGFIMELFGVSTGLWSYPVPDFLGMPYWFVTMWISVGLLGCRFLIPLAEWLARRVAPQGA